MRPFVRLPLFARRSAQPSPGAAAGSRGLHVAAAAGALRRWLGRVGSSGGRRLRALWAQRAVKIACPTVAVMIALPPALLFQHLYLDRSGLPDLAPFIEFKPPVTGEILDARGEVVVQLAREYRRVVTYEEVPLVVRQAVLAAEDKNFHSHSGVEYGALPRVIQKTLCAPWRSGGRAPGCGCCCRRAARRSPSSSCASTSSAT